MLLEGNERLNLDRESYFNYLEKDYYQRMYEKYGDELGLFGRIDSPIIKDGLMVLDENN